MGGKDHRALLRFSVSLDVFALGRERQVEYTPELRGAGGLSGWCRCTGCRPVALKL